MRAGPRPLRGQDKIAVRADRVLARRKVAKHFTVEIGEDHVRYARNQDSIAAEAKLDGIYVLRTSVAATDLDSPQVVSSYKALAQVERAFRAFNTDLDIRRRPPPGHGDGTRESSDPLAAAARERGQPASAGRMPGHANLSEEGRESRPDPEQTETTTMGTQRSHHRSRHWMATGKAHAWAGWPRCWPRSSPACWPRPPRPRSRTRSRSRSETVIPAISRRSRPPPSR